MNKHQNTLQIVEKFASTFILIAMSVRGLVDYVYYDMLSMIGFLCMPQSYKRPGINHVEYRKFLLVLRNFLEYLNQTSVNKCESVPIVPFVLMSYRHRHRVPELCVFVSFFFIP